MSRSSIFDIAEARRRNVKALQRIIHRDDLLFTAILDAWDHSEGDTLAGLIDDKVRERVGRI